MEALVEFDYKAQESDELTIKKGDIITNIDARSGGWWEGTLARVGKRGMFPDNFVKILGDANVSQETKSDTTHRTSSGKKCQVLFSYLPANEDELELHVGDIIEFLGEEEEGWWKGKLKSQIGVFPSNFVMEIAETSEVKETTLHKTKISHEEITKQTGLTIDNNSHQNTPNSNTSNIEPSDAPVLPPKPSKEMCRVLFPYEAANDDELTLHEGDLITLITKDGQDVGWWKGELRGKIGVFPDNFVQLIPADELHKPDRPSKIVTTNRIRDSITKPATTSITPVSASKKFLESQKLEEKVSPPSVSKKPSLPPPPLKKPLRNPIGSDITKSATAPSLATKLPDSPTSGINTKLPLSTISSAIQSVTQHMSRSTTETSSSSSKWTVVEADNLDGMMWSRQSYSVTSGSSSSSMSVSASSTIADLDLDQIGRAAMLTHPTASRAKAPRRRLPTGMLNKEENKEEDEEEEEEEEETDKLLNGNAEVTMLEKPPSLAPWVKELKLSQAKKQAGKTRVIIGPAQTEPVLPPEPNKSLLLNLRSKISDSGTAGQKTDRPLSLFNLSKPAPTPPTGNTTINTEETVTITVKQWNDVNEKISKLESLHEILSKAVKELSEKLEEETQKRLVMEQELEKITGVTV